MNQAKKIQYSEIKLNDILIIKVAGNLQPVKIVKYSPLSKYYIPLNFCWLGYEDDDQHAFYNNKKLWNFKDKAERLLKKEHPEIYRVREGSHMSYHNGLYVSTDPFDFAYLEHKAYTNQFKFHMDESKFVNEGEEGAGIPLYEWNQPAPVEEAPVVVAYIPQQPPNA
jgi:hypothetical protein